MRTKPIPETAAFGIDIGKKVFHVVALNAAGAVIQRAKFSRDTLMVASHVALGRHDEARTAFETCKKVLPAISAEDAERMPLRDAAKMQEFRDRLCAAGFSLEPQT